MTYDDLLDYLQREHRLALRPWRRGHTRFYTGTKDGRGGITGSGATYEEAAWALFELAEKAWAVCESLVQE